MSGTQQPRHQETSVQPGLESLLSRYLQRHAEDHAAGLAAEPAGEVVPHEVGPVQPIDARPAWEAAVAVGSHYGIEDTRKLQPPPQWSHLVAAHEPAMALPFCLGNFPQLVRNFQTLTQTKDIGTLRPVAGQPVSAEALQAWAREAVSKKQYAQVLLALGALRLANQFDVADDLVKACSASMPKQWQEAWANEQAALAWQRGRCEEALALWQAMPPSVPVKFNCGMAALFCGKKDDARTALSEAVSQIPESSSWHHLGRLYLTLIDA